MTQLREAKVPKLDVVLPPSADGSSFEIYRTISAAQVEISLPEGTRPQDFFIEGANYQLPHAVLTQAHASAQRMRCVPGQGGPEAAPTMQLYLYVAGTSEAVCEGRHARFGPGDIVIYDSRRGYEVEVTAFDVRIVMVPQNRVPPILLSPGVHGLRLPAEEAGTRLLAATVENLLREVEGLSVAEADHAALALWQIAAGLVQTHLARRERGGRPGVDPQLDAAMAYIDRHYAEVDLTPDMVCAHLGVSRSGLYRLFAPLGGIGAVIRQRRLDCSMRALLAGAPPTLSLRKLAQRHGFRGETQFTRAFQARFGTTPSLVRAKIATDDRAWLVAQAERAGFASLQAWLGVLATGLPEARDSAA